VLLAVVGCVFMTIILIGVTYLVSFISLISYESELFDLLNFGPEGLLAFMNALPWVLIVLVIVLGLAIYFLLRDYSFVYTKPVVYGVFGVASIIFLTSFGVNHFDTGYSIARFGEDDNIPVLFLIHNRYRQAPHMGEITHGQIIASSTHGFIMQDLRTKEYVTVFVTENTREDRAFTIGDYVTVFGPFGTSTIGALGIKSFDPHAPLPPFRPRHN